MAYKNPYPLHFARAVYRNIIGHGEKQLPVIPSKPNDKREKIALSVTAHALSTDQGTNSQKMTIFIEGQAVP